MNLGPLSLPKDVGERQERCRWWWIVDKHRQRCRDRKLIDTGACWTMALINGHGVIFAARRLFLDHMEPMCMLGGRHGSIQHRVETDGHRRSSLAPTACWQIARLDGHDGLLNLYFVSSKDEYLTLTVFVAKRRGQTTITTPKRLRSLSTMNIMNI